jgi:tetratricopeptide (TPR) repeat protein
MSDQSHTAPFDDLLQAGLAASQSNDVDKAIELFGQASLACPASGVPHFLAGSEYAALGQFDKAEAALANAVLLAPEFHIARYQLGLLQFSSGRAAVALVTWEPLFALDDAQAIGHFVRGFAALAHDDFEHARAHFKAGLDRNTENAAMSQDIEQVLRGIEEAQHKSSGSSMAEPSEDSAHVLLSNYGKFGGTVH